MLVAAADFAADYLMPRRRCHAIVDAVIDASARRLFFAAFAVYIYAVFFFATLLLSIFASAIRCFRFSPRR